MMINFPLPFIFILMAMLISSINVNGIQERQKRSKVCASGRKLRHTSLTGDACAERTRRQAVGARVE